jgi:hypothetical protein
MEQQIIGQSKVVKVPEVCDSQVHARIDTGARTSSIWASSIKETETGLEVIFFGKSSPNFTGQQIVFSEYGETVVASSNGHVQARFKVRLQVVINGRRIKAWFTLADRSEQVYPILIGRNVLRGKFLVDVSHTTDNLKSKEKMRTMELHSRKHLKKA